MAACGVEDTEEAEDENNAEDADEAPPSDVEADLLEDIKEEAIEEVDGETVADIDDESTAAEAVAMVIMLSLLGFTGHSRWRIQRLKVLIQVDRSNRALWYLNGFNVGSVGSS